MLENLSVTTACLTLALGITCVALGLLFWLRFERGCRGDQLSEFDRRHYSKQDLRRNSGITLLLLIAQGIAISPAIDLRVAGRPNILYLVLWLAVFLFVIVLLVLALLDMMATRAYAKRHRDAILRERHDLIIQLEQIAHRSRSERDEASIEPDSAYD